MKQHTLAHTLLVLALPLGLSACISVSLGQGDDDKSAPTSYTLRDTESDVMDVAADAAGRIVMVVSTPEVPPGFDNDSITIRFEDGRVDRYADARWSARLDQLLQDVVVDRAQRKLPDAIVGKPGGVPAPNYRLLVNVTDFGPVYKDTPDMSPRLDVGLNVMIEVPGNVVRAQ